MKLNIIPDTDQFQNVKDTVRLSWTYMHGELERKYHFDIYDITRDSIAEGVELEHEVFIVDSSLPEGIYEAECEGEPCTLFYWHEHRGNSIKGRGLVVLNSDKKHYRDALKKYQRRETFI